MTVATPSPTPSPFLIEIVSKGESFWDSPLIGLVGGLAGVIVGAGLTYWFAVLQDNRKAKRELETRYLDEIQRSSAAAVLAASDIVQHLFNWETVLQLEPHVVARKSTEAVLDEFPDQIWEADERLNRAFAEILIVAPEHLRTLANELQTEAYEATRTQGEVSRIVAARIATRKAGMAYEAAVRDFFGVSEPNKNAPKGVLTSK